MFVTVAFQKMLPQEQANCISVNIMCGCVCVCDQCHRAKLPSSSSPPSVVGSLSGCFGLLEAFHTQTHEPVRQFSLLECEPVFPVKWDSSKSSVQWEYDREDSYQEHFTRKWLK